MKLDLKEQERYARNIIIDELGEEGQLKLKSSKVLVAGAGGLGSPASLYLAASGVGTIGIIDNDLVDISNLQRQIIHYTDDINTEKVVSAKNKLSALNPEIKIVPIKKYLDSNNIKEIFEDYDFVIDATDNFESKFLINDTCVEMKKAFSHAGVQRFNGQVFTYVPSPDSACLRCLVNDIPGKGSVPLPAETGVLGTAAGLLGCIQATEAIKYISGMGKLLNNKMLIIDLLNMRFSNLTIKKNKECKLHQAISD